MSEVLYHYMELAGAIKLVREEYGLTPNDFRGITLGPINAIVKKFSDAADETPQTITHDEQRQLEEIAEIVYNAAQAKAHRKRSLPSLATDIAPIDAILNAAQDILQRQIKESGGVSTPSQIAIEITKIQGEWDEMTKLSRGRGGRGTEVEPKLANIRVVHLPGLDEKDDLSR